MGNSKQVKTGGINKTIGLLKRRLYRLTKVYETK